MVKAKKNEELVSDPRELLLSLVDMGSLDVEDALLACVKEMSDAECKRVLSGISLPNCCDMEDEDMPADSEDDFMSDEPSDEFSDDTLPEESSEDKDEDSEESDNSEDEEDDEVEAELEARIRRLERSLRFESMNRNRLHRVSRRRTTTR